MHRNEKGQFVKGQSGNPAGRPRGSRNKTGKAFLAELYAHWIKNGAAAIERVRQKRPKVYLKLVASLLPKQLDIKEDPFDELTDEELAAVLAYIRNAIAVAQAGGETGASEATQ